MSAKRPHDHAAPPKSQKRIRIENEIFSKSLHDIETMFSFNHIVAHSALGKTASSVSVHTPPSPPHNDPHHSQYTIPLIPGEHNNDLNYDCINLAFLESDLEPVLAKPAPRVRPLSAAKPRPTNLYINGAYDWDDDDDDFARVNLERDLELMDRVFMRMI